MRIPSGVTNLVIYFVAVDAVDLVTRKTGLTTFTVFRSRNGAAAAAYTIPTVAEVSATNMPGVYTLLIDEDTTIAAGNDSEEVCLHITHAGMAPVTAKFELYRPDTTLGSTLDVTATGAGGIDWGNVENPATAVDLSATDIQLCDTVTFSAASLVIQAMVDTVVNTHTPTTTVFQSDTITEATADHYNGRIVIFTSGVLTGQATTIADYVAVGGIGQFTVTAMTEAPANNDTFVIV